MLIDIIFIYSLTTYNTMARNILYTNGAFKEKKKRKKNELAFSYHCGSNNFSTKEDDGYLQVASY